MGCYFQENMNIMCSLYCLLLLLLLRLLLLLLLIIIMIIIIRKCINRPVLESIWLLA